MKGMKKLLQQSDNSSLYSMESSDSDQSDYEAPSSEIATGSKKRNGGGRLPTRRPDPNIYNRNALLARENRKKKKFHLETVEKELEEVRKENRELKKTLKRQVKSSRRLEQEKKYFKSMLENRTEIMSLLRALNARLPGQCASETSLALLNNVSLSPPDSLGTFRRTSRSSSYEASSINVDNSDNDLEKTAFDSAWDDLLREDFGSTSSGTVAEPQQGLLELQPSQQSQSYQQQQQQQQQQEQQPHKQQQFQLPSQFQPESVDALSDSLYNINSEHSYVTSSGGYRDETDQVGVCLHIARGRVSLEFCPTCHWSSHRSPPEQLFENNLSV